MTDESLAGDSHWTWGRERATQRLRVDVFREPPDGDLSGHEWLGLT